MLGLFLFLIIDIDVPNHVSRYSLSVFKTMRFVSQAAASAAAALLVTLGIVIPTQPAQAYPPNAIVVEFTTGANEVAEIGFGGDLVGVSIDWGDGSAADVIPDGTGVTDALYPHTYISAGTHEAVISATTISHFGYCGTAQNFWNLTRVLSWGSMNTTDMSCAFWLRTALTEVPSTLPSTVTSLRSMFQAASVFDQDLSGWDTENVTDMYGVFRMAFAFNNGGVDMPWITSSVVTMENMFSVASSFNADVTTWNTHNVTNMDGTFSAAESFNQSLASWNMSQVAHLETIFEPASGTPPAWSLSDENYSSTLIGWAAQTLQPNVTLGASANQAVGCPAIAARATLLGAPNNWTITDITPTDVVPSGGCSPAAPTSSLADTGGNIATLLIFTLGLIGLGVIVLLVLFLVRRRKL